MSKAILVLEMPSSCSKCDFCEHQDEGWLWCSRCKKTARAFDKPDWCPLRELPQKYDEKDYTPIKDERYENGYEDGYNACIDEIMKGSEENG